MNRGVRRPLQVISGLLLAAFLVVPVAFDIDQALRDPASLLHAPLWPNLTFWGAGIVGLVLLLFLLREKGVGSQKPVKVESPPGRTAVRMEGGKGTFRGFRSFGQDTGFDTRNTDLDVTDGEVR